jgi:hypothetical protein
MASSAKRRQTMAKMTRERKVREKRELKREKKEARKMAAAMDATEGANGMFSESVDGSEDAETEPLADAPEEPAVS